MKKKWKKKPSASNGGRSRVKVNARRRKKPNRVSGKPQSVNPKQKSKTSKLKPVGKIPLKRIGASSSGTTEEEIQDLKPGHEKEIESCGETEITKGRFCVKCNKSTFFINHRQEKILINGRSEICHVADCESCGNTRPIRAI